MTTPANDRKAACETIREALEKCEQFSDDFGNDKQARSMWVGMTVFLDAAHSCANTLVDKAQKWAEADHARRYPHPTAREKAEHNEP